MANVTATDPTTGWSHRIDPEHHGPLVTITAALMLVGTLMLAATRLAIRWPWSRLLGNDDAAAFASTALAIGQTIAVFFAVHSGLGRHEDDLVSVDSLQTIEKLIYASDILYVVAIGGSQLSVALLLLRLPSTTSWTWTARIITGVVIAWGVSAILAVAIRPNLAQPWDLTSSDAGEIANAWTGLGITSVLVEIALLTFPIVLVCNLQMATSARAIVITGFAFRIPKMAFTIVRVVAIRYALINPHDISWTYVTPEIWTQIEMHYSVIAATIPSMHIFLKTFSTGYYGTTADQVDRSITPRAGFSEAKSSHMMSRMSKSKGSVIVKSQVESDIDPLWPTTGTTTSNITHNDISEDMGSIVSDTSQVNAGIVVRKTVQIDWARDTQTNLHVPERA